ncbi:MAG: hypothetical protein IPK13_10580 [Deltaproteobacteria bacterium]|nr:hypothetical protein [Deltaproteobacteria bacterium]
MSERLRVAVLAEDTKTRSWIASALKTKGVEVFAAASGVELLELLGDGETSDVVLGVEGATSERGPAPTSMQVLASTRTFGDETPFVIVDEQNFSRTALAASRMRNAAVVPTLKAALSLIRETEPSRRPPLHRHGQDSDSDSIVARPPETSAQAPSLTLLAPRDR